MKPTHIKSTVIALFCGISAMAQLHNAHWVFGTDLGLSFQSGNPELTTSSCDPSSARQPAVISDESGNLVCYTDGDKVYNSSHDVIENGDLSMAAENLIVPAPGYDDRYYLFRSNGSGFFYCIIDMSMDGGSGGIQPGDVDIEINNVYCQVTGTAHPNGTDIWIITSDNENGISDDIRYTSYLLTTEGLQQVDSVQEYYIFGGWYNTPDDLRISPDCTKLATTYKGHYLVLCRFDNANGDLYDLMPSYVDMQTSFVVADLDKVEFSPNSNYLYALGDQHLIKQYSLEFWNESSIANSVTTIYDSGWGSGEIWTDMKLGPDDKIYLHDIESDELDVIANPDAPGTDVEITQGIITGLDLDSFFPNTAGYQCSVAASVIVEHIYECLGDSTEFYYSITSPADSVTWNFGDPDTGLDNFSTLDSPIHVFSDVGTYYITFNYFLYGEWNSVMHEVTIYTIPEVDLPEIIEACEGDEVVIDAGESPYSYTWTTGDTTQTIIVTLPGIYTVSVSNGSCFAGDFTQVSFLGPVELDLEFNYTLCEGDSLVLDLSDSGAETIEWSNGETDPVIVITESGNFNVYAENACASSSQNFGVDVIDLPSSLLPGSIVQCVSEPVVLSVDYPGADVAWSTGETGQQITVEESGTYAVSVEVGNCTAEDEISVTLYEYIPLDDIEIPNIFTPNGDSDNEVFRPFLKSDPEFDLCGFSGIQIDMQVYDRWGILHADHVCSWDGKSDGGQWLSEEVFYYIIDMRSSCGSTDEHKKCDGWVHLIR